MGYTKHTITIYTPPSSGMELSSLASQAEHGLAICTDYTVEQTERGDLPKEAAAFFEEVET